MAHKQFPADLVGGDADAPRLTPVEHYRAAEQLVSRGSKMKMTNPDLATLLFAEAMVHASLAAGRIVYNNNSGGAW